VFGPVAYATGDKLDSVYAAWMELRQLRYFVRIVELGSMSRAAVELNVVQSALSQQIARLEGELATRLLQRSSKGVAATEAGIAFFQQAQLALRHADEAVRAAQQSRLSGMVSIGLAPTTASVLGVPLMLAVRERYPDVRLHMVESLSGHLAAMLNDRQLDLAVLFDTDPGRRWSVTPLLEEKLFLVRSLRAGRDPLPAAIDLAGLAEMPLILPSTSHGLRRTLDVAFSTGRLPRLQPMEIDSLAMLMDAVKADLGCTIQPLSALARFPDAPARFEVAEIADARLRRLNSLCSVSDGELSPAALAVRVALADCAAALVRQGAWAGATLSHHAN
jgi:LysR family tcuABC transcriptional regulator